MKLDQGDIFPSLSGPMVNGDTLTLSQDLKTPWTIVLGYRAHW